MTEIDARRFKLPASATARKNRRLPRCRLMERASWRKWPARRAYLNQLIGQQLTASAASGLNSMLRATLTSTRSDRTWRAARPVSAARRRVSRGPAALTPTNNSKRDRSQPTVSARTQYTAFLGSAWTWEEGSSRTGTHSRFSEAALRRPRRNQTCSTASGRVLLSRMGTVSRRFRSARADASRVTDLSWT